MSNVLYPLSLIKSVETQPVSRTLKDAFEDGSTAARSLWPEKWLKRKIKVTHSPLTTEEARWLRGFITQRSGEYDPFWFRDNINRTGNAYVRLAAPVQFGRDAAAIRDLAVQLEEVAAIRQLPEIDEVYAAAGRYPIVWHDANRELYYSHVGAVYSSAQLYDAAMQQYPAEIQASSLPDVLSNVLGQWQHYSPDGTFWARGAEALPLAAGKPAMSVFLFAKNPAAGGTSGYLACCGVYGEAVDAGENFNVILANDNNYYVTFSQTYGDGILPVANTPANTWRSFCATARVNSDDTTLYCNAVAIGTATKTRSYKPGPLGMAASNDGYTKLPAGGGIGHLMVFDAALTIDQVKALHNLFGYQFGLAPVA